MAGQWEKMLDRWEGAGLIDAATASGIRAYETGRAAAPRGRWPVLVALALGGIMLAAGVILFVGAHWSELSPGARFASVLTMVAAFHIAAGLAPQGFESWRATLHALGTISLGAAIYLTAQIFNLQEHWPAGLLLWSLGAAAGFWLRRDAAHGILLAVLVPSWLISKWWLAAGDSGPWFGRIASLGLVILAATYLSAQAYGKDTALRRALFMLGLIGLAATIPWVEMAWRPGLSYPSMQSPTLLSNSGVVMGWIVAFAFPLSVAWLLRQKDAWMNLIAGAWAVGFAAVVHASFSRSLATVGATPWPVYFWGLVGAAALAAWGVRDGRSERTFLGAIAYTLDTLLFLFDRAAHGQATIPLYLLVALLWTALVAGGVEITRSEPVNLGVVGFGLTVMTFYFSTVMDKVGRSLSLIGLGALFLFGGWQLERLRRRLVARAKRA